MKFFLLLALTAHLFGCASYHLGHYKRHLPGGYDRVAIPMFTNKTDEVGIENYFTKALKFEFERSRLATVTSKEHAQIIIEGFIKSVDYVGGSPTKYDEKEGLQTPTNSNTNPLPKGTTLFKSYTASLVVQLVAKKVSDNTIIWTGDFSSSKGFSGALIGSPQYNYANPLYNQSARVQTIEKQAKEMMLEAHDRMTENF
ncbi:MAG: LptE family protein [Oligoflexia bacterium]|nr:LptE family protein [Oligoflexia bacterium]